jgi:phosphate-selective porin OprO and OprP
MDRKRPSIGGAVPQRSSAPSLCGVILSLWSAAASVAAQESSQPQAQPVPTPQSQSQEKTNDWHFGWDEGFKLQSSDKSFDLKFGGYLFLDWTFVDADAEIDAQATPLHLHDSNEIRVGRFSFEGTLYRNVEFKLQYDFADGTAGVRDAYIGFKNTPLGTIRVGHAKEPFGFEEMTSIRYLPFLERSLSVVFVPDRNTGIWAFDNLHERITWAAGAFRDAGVTGSTPNGEGALDVTARLTGLPVMADGGSRLLHLGVSGSFRDLPHELFRFAARPEAHQVPPIASTGTFAAQRFVLLGAETAGVAGPFWAAAEYIGVRGFDTRVVSRALSGGGVEILTNCTDCTPGQELGDVLFQGATLQAGWFLTGEHRRYNSAQGVFDRTRPKRNFGAGPGAWEIAGRVSNLDLNDGRFTGGELWNASVGVNWYVNPVTRVMANYIYSERSDLAGDPNADLLLVRFQIDF